jgi:hypothetical protein
LKTKKNGNKGGGKEIFRTNAIFKKILLALRKQKIWKNRAKNPKNLLILKET